MWEAIFDGLKAVWDWFFSLLASMCQGFLEALLGILPNSFQETITQSGSTIGFALSAGNAWLPLDFFFTLLGLYAIFVLAFLGIKVVIKLIP